MVIVNLHGLGSTGDNARYVALKEYYNEDKDITIVSPTYTVHDYNKGLSELLIALDDYVNEEILFIGASTGAIYANQLANLYDGKCILINPLVNPSEQLKSAIGTHNNYNTNEKFTVTKENTLAFPEYKDIGMTILVARDDELLDYTEVFKHPILKNKAIVVSATGTHRFNVFEEYLGLIDTVINTYNL